MTEIVEETPNAATNGTIEWGSIFSREFLRVLLVEADDSTRKIVAALLRKCEYRVIAVADGLKAWEVLKESSPLVDLVLTEVDLPSISGYALLTLIMEHDVCRNIPVIMMSSQGAVNGVYKCMIKGAADYLVKPMRRNELRNLWQHVWRRRSCHPGGAVLEEGYAEDKMEEEDKSRCKDSDALSSCASLETGGKEAEWSSMVDDSFCHAGEVTGTYSFAIVESNSGSKNDRERNSESGELPSACNYESSFLLELSLQGAQFDDSEKEAKDVLNHSNGSAFTRYKSKPATDDLNRTLHKTSSCLQQRVVPIQIATAVGLGWRPVVSPVEVNNNEKNGRISPTTAQSTNSSFCRKSEKWANSSEREAALMKFRLKRKERCYEKKVRYESRKKLAEQRPRVKGQFVRQSDHQS